MFPEARQLHVRARSILTSGRRYLPPTAIDGSSCQRGVSPSITRLYSVQQVTSVHERPTPSQTTGAPDGTNSSKGLTSYEQNLPTKREVREEFNGKNDVAPNRPRHGRGGGRDPPPSDTHAAGRLIDALVTTSIGLGAVFLGGLVYVNWYKKNVLDKMEAAFLLGHDQAISRKKSRINKTVLANDEAPQADPALSSPEQQHSNMRRKEQEIIDHIIQGNEPTHYYMVLGPKGAGKGEMILDAVAACNGEGVALCCAHPDLEVFRVRVGKALNFEFNEDTQLGLFQWREPREAGPSLDIERALNKLEESCSTLIFHQREAKHAATAAGKAEEWAASGILTMIFSSDDFWPFSRYAKERKPDVLSVNYQPQQEAMYASKRMKSTVAEEVDREEVVSIVGGRPYRFDKAARSKGMKFIADYMVQIEKQWLLSQIGLVPDCDDDIIEDQKWSSRAWLLLREFVKLREEQLATSPASGTQNDLNDIPLPTIPYWKCREIMTRPDFMEELDRLNIIAIDTQYNVRPDSNLILLAAREVVREDGFEDRLHHVRNKIDELETLQRTRELLFNERNKALANVNGFSRTEKHLDEYHKPSASQATS